MAIPAPTQLKELQFLSAPTCFAERCITKRQVHSTKKLAMRCQGKLRFDLLVFFLAGPSPLNVCGILVQQPLLSLLPRLIFAAFLVAAPVRGPPWRIFSASRRLQMRRSVGLSVAQTASALFRVSVRVSRYLIKSLEVKSLIPAPLSGCLALSVLLSFYPDGAGSPCPGNFCSRRVVVGQTNRLTELHPPALMNIKRTDSDSKNPITNHIVFCSPPIRRIHSPPFAT